jgi:5'-nucleotidase
VRILITNDDGIHAEGLDVLEKIARELTDDVIVVAPETDQSGVAHSLSLSNPLRLRETAPNRYAVRGTPTDCVLMGVRHILGDEKPDLILSGVNRGQNVAEDVTYSGTIAGAMEGTILGVPSIAMSQAFGPASVREGIHWACAQTHGARIVRRILDLGLPPGALANVNFPDRRPDEVTGVSVTRQGYRGPELLKIDKRTDGRGFPYYWLAFARPKYEYGEGTDLEALAEGRISITPLRLDLTCRDLHTRWARSFD